MLRAPDKTRHLASSSRNHSRGVPRGSAPADSQPLIRVVEQLKELLRRLLIVGRARIERELSEESSTPPCRISPDPCRLLEAAFLADPSLGVTAQDDESALAQPRSV